MKSIILTCLLALSLGLVTACADDTKKEEKKDVKEVAVMKTTMGEMVIELWPDQTPKTVENFKKLAKQGFYDGTAFHRIIKGFMIQGGDPKTKDPAKSAEYGTGGPGYSIPDEFHTRPHDRGVISMAHSGMPNSGGSQFFICLDSQACSQLNGGYAAFGKVIKGDDVLTKLGDVPCTGPNSMGEMSIPKDRVGIVSVKIVPADSVK